jgi:hypothetical protein
MKLFKFFKKYFGSSKNLQNTNELKSEPKLKPSNGNGSAMNYWENFYLGSFEPKNIETEGFNEKSEPKSKNDVLNEFKEYIKNNHIDGKFSKTKTEIMSDLKLSSETKAQRLRQAAIDDKILIHTNIRGVFEVNIDKLINI